MIRDMIQFSVQMPALPAPHDVHQRILTLIANDERIGQQHVPLGVKRVEGLEVPQDTEVTLELVYVDDSGNRSEPATHTFVAKDTTPPATPGAFGVTITGETHKVNVEKEAEEEPSTATDPHEPEVFTEEDMDEPGVVDTDDPETEIE